MRDLGSVIGDVFSELARQEQTEADAKSMELDEYREWRAAESRRVEEEKWERKAQREEQRRRAKWIDTFKQALPEAACAELYDGQVQQTDAIRHVKTWLDSDTPCLILCGGVGTGKTYAGVWAAKERWGDFCMAQSLARRVDPWKHEIEHTTLLHLEAPLIVLDDLGAEQDDARFGQALFALVNCRNASDRRTLITTNLTIPQIRPRYGDRIADRLNAMAKAVQLKGASMRKQGAGL
jgi:DNA replication protein DnaC